MPTLIATVAPFERIRLLLQTQSLIPGHAKPYNGLFDALQRIPREQGITSLWRGNVPNLLRIVPTYGVRFTLFDYFQSIASLGLQKGEPLSLPRQMASGALSGLVTCVVTYPLDLARTRMSATAASLDAAAASQAASSESVAAAMGGKAATSAPEKITTAGALRAVVRTEGFLGLYRGLFVSVLEITPYLAISLGMLLTIWDCACFVCCGQTRREKFTVRIIERTTFFNASFCKNYRKWFHQVATSI